jgi:hypothetical protein
MKSGKHSLSSDVQKPLADFHWNVWVDLIHCMDQYLLFSLLIPQNAMHAGFRDTSFAENCLTVSFYWCHIF